MRYGNLIKKIRYGKLKTIYKKVLFGQDVDILVSEVYLTYLISTIVDWSTPTS